MSEPIAHLQRVNSGFSISLNLIIHLVWVTHYKRIMLSIETAIVTDLGSYMVNSGNTRPLHRHIYKLYILYLASPRLQAMLFKTYIEISSCLQWSSSINRYWLRAVENSARYSPSNTVCIHKQLRMRIYTHDVDSRQIAVPTNSYLSLYR